MENENLKCYNDECPRYDPEQRDGSNCSTLSSAFLKSCRTYDDGTIDENEENLSQSLSILNRNIKEIREYLETVNKNYQEIGKDIYDSNQSIIKHNMSVSALADQVEASVEEFKKDMKTEKHNRDYTFKELLSRIGRLENDVRILDDRITGMQNRNQRRDKEIFELEASRSIDDDTDNNQEIRNVAIENRIKILETPEKPSKNIKK